MEKNHLNNGHSTVHRTGRFGIGLLSAYLLGDEINVITRHISEPENKGLQFKCKKDSEHIEIKNVTADFGTTISIKISKEVANTLANNTSSWDWFCGKDILVKRKVETETGVKELSQQYIMPSCNGELPENWYRTSHTDYDDIIWTYEKLSKRQYGYDRYLFCNSIYVSNDIRFDDFNLSEELGIIKCSIPQLIIYDQDGRLPLNLERTSLNSRAISFKEQLYGDIADYYVEQAKLNFDQVKGDVNKDIISKSINPNILGSIDSYYYSEEKASKYIISDNILIPFDFNIIKEHKLSSLFIEPIKSTSNGIWNNKEIFKKLGNYYPVLSSSDAKSRRSHLIRHYFQIEGMHNYGTKSRYTGLAGLPIKGKRIFIRKHEEDRLVAPSYVPKTFWNKLESEWENNEWSVYTIGDISSLNIDYSVLTSQLKSEDSFSLIQIDLDWDLFKSETEESYFSKSWFSKIGKTYITIEK